MLRLWDALVACSVTLGIVITALGVMLQIIEVQAGMRRIGVVLGCAILLIILPPIIIGIWSGLLIWQKAGVLSLVGIAVVALRVPRRNSRNRGGFSNRH